MHTNLLYGLLFLVIVMASYWFLISWWPHRVNRRLTDLLRPHESRHHGTWTSRLTAWPSSFSQWLVRISPWLLRDAATWQTDGSPGASPHAQALRLKLLNAGIQSPQAVMIFQTWQTLLALLLPLMMLGVLWWWRPPLQQASMVIVLILAGMIGYYLPQAFLQRQIRLRQDILLRGFPDALDLMRMCIQAGLGLDATLDRVGREIRLSCPPLSQELALTGYELRAGASRAQALRHLVERIAMQDVEAWVNTLIQSDRFGTSLSESLQVYSDALRNKRKLIAQEAAAKLPIKLLIPLVFCLFPGLLTVLLGPAVINITTQLLPVLSKSQ